VSWFGEFGGEILADSKKIGKLTSLSNGIVTVRFFLVSLVVRELPWQGGKIVERGGRLYRSREGSKCYIGRVFLGSSAESIASETVKESNSKLHVLGGPRHHGR